MAHAKIMIVGLSNSGKTTLLNTLKDTLVISRDGKPFPLNLPHVNIRDYDTIDELINLTAEKMGVFKKTYENYPKTVVFDSVSRIFTDIENNCNRQYKGFDVWSNINIQVNKFVESINQIVENIANVIIIAHAVWDEKAGKFVETCKGSFAKTGGFLSTVDFAIHTDRINNQYWIHTKGTSLSRTLIDEMPKDILADEFNLQDYVETINNRLENISKTWSL